MAKDNPDLFEAIRGAAHFYDLYASKTQESDPELRNKLDRMDEVSVADALHLVNDVVVAEGDATVADPVMSVEDSAAGVRVTLDVSDSPVVQSEVGAEEVAGGVGITAGDWSTMIDVDPPVMGIERSTKPGMVVFDIETGPAKTEQLTIAQYFDQNPQAEEQMRAEYGDSEVDFLIENLGDEPAETIEEKLP